MKRIFFYFLMIQIAIACDGNQNTSLQNKEVYSRATNDMEATAEVIQEMEAPSVAKSNINSNEQKLIRTAYLSFETKSVDKTYQLISKLINKYKGYIQSDNTSKQYNRIHRSLVVRIPNKNFQYTVDSIVKNVKVLDRKDISSQDVTEEFIDLEARLSAKRKLEERYLQLLAKAKTVKDMLEIERNIAKIREEIEAKQGRLKYLQKQVAYSTLHIDFYQIIAKETAPSQTYISRLWRAVKGGFNSIGDFVIGLVYVWPFILIAILIGLFIRHRIRKIKK